MSRRRNTESACAVLGDGGWGTTLAIHLSRLGHRVRLWGAFAENIAAIRRERENRSFLPGIPIPKAVALTSALDEALDGASFVVVAVPSQYLRGVVRRITRGQARGKLFVSVAKGIERGSLLRMSEVMRQELPGTPVGVLSGPSIALEVAQGRPASLVAAAARQAFAEDIQRWFMTDRLRVYTSTDLAGVEFGGALKNPIAIAAGACDGLKLGSNAKAALITRGVVEMARLGVAAGARQETFWGLSGLGDLVTTCFSGRNRWLGEQLGRGKPLRAVLRSTSMVIEGVETARSARELAKRLKIDVPIIEQVMAVLFQRRAPATALAQLMQRQPKPEA